MDRFIMCVMAGSSSALANLMIEVYQCNLNQLPLNFLSFLSSYQLCQDGQV